LAKRLTVLVVAVEHAAIHSQAIHPLPHFFFMGGPKHFRNPAGAWPAALRPELEPDYLAPLTKPAMAQYLRWAAGGAGTTPDSGTARVPTADGVCPVMSAELLVSSVAC
jgi:hypothetical protein